MRSSGMPLVAALLGFAACICSFAVLPARAQDGLSDGPQASELRNAFDVSTLEPGVRPLVTLPLTFDVAPTCRLYFNGSRIESVLVEWDPQRGLTLNGRSWMPPEPDPLANVPFFTEDDNLKMWGKCPFVADRLERGWGVIDARNAYWIEKERLMAVMDTAYCRSRRAGLPALEATRLSLKQGEAADTAGIIDVAFSRPVGLGVRVKWVNDSCNDGYPLHVGPSILAPTPDSTSPQPIPDDTSARAWATQLYKALAGLADRHCIVIIPLGWVRLCGDMAERAFDQIDAMNPVADPEAAARALEGHGPVSVGTLRAIAYAEVEGRESR
jgi:hypothetical protein